MKTKEQYYFEAFVSEKHDTTNHSSCGLNQAVYAKYTGDTHNFSPSFLMHHGLKLITAIKSEAQFEQNVFKLIDKDKKLHFQLNKALGLSQKKSLHTQLRLKKDIILIGRPKYIVTLIYTMFQQFIKNETGTSSKISELAQSWNLHLLTVILARKQNYTEQGLKNLLFNLELSITLIKLEKVYRENFDDIKNSVLQRLFFIKNVEKYEVIERVQLQEPMLEQAIIQNFSFISQNKFPKYLVPRHKRNTFSTNTLGALFVMQCTFMRCSKKEMLSLSHRLINDFISEESVFMPLRGMINFETSIEHSTN